jgi:hypothetical protein
VASPYAGMKIGVATAGHQRPTLRSSFD